MTSAPVKAPRRDLITRSEVASGLPYREYKEHLREDFIFSCAYCTLTEMEGGGARFTIDHYEPVSARRDLENSYENLMYCCDFCNSLKGDRCPPPDARKDGYRFFRPDDDAYGDHFEHASSRLRGKSKVGDFTIEYVDLNRRPLRRLREIRQRLNNADEYVVEGIRGLRRLPLDLLPQSVKERAFFIRSNAEKMELELTSAIDAALGESAKSPLLDPDPEARKRAKQRAERGRALRQLYPGAWSSRQTKSPDA